MHEYDDRPPRSLHQLTLRDGAVITLRPIAPDDKALLVDAMEHRLSENSRYRRFFTPVRRLTLEQLGYFTEVDHVDHFAWVAVTTSDSEQLVGVARYIRSSVAPSIAELALTVVDAWQRRGAGAILLAALAEVAQEHGVRMFRADVLADNHPMLHLLDRFGAGRPTYTGAGVVERYLDVVENRESLRAALEAATAERTEPATSPPVRWRHSAARLVEDGVRFGAWLVDAQTELTFGALSAVVRTTMPHRAGSGERRVREAA